jgi:hypothetical protein
MDDCTCGHPYDAHQCICGHPYDAHQGWTVKVIDGNIVEGQLCSRCDACIGYQAEAD